jgi:hypothetical protein
MQKKRLNIYAKKIFMIPAYTKRESICLILDYFSHIFAWNSWASASATSRKQQVPEPLRWQKLERPRLCTRFPGTQWLKSSPRGTTFEPSETNLIKLFWPQFTLRLIRLLQTFPLQPDPLNSSFMPLSRPTVHYRSSFLAKVKRGRKNKSARLK